MPEPLHFTEAEKSAYRAAYAPTATEDQWNLFLLECERRALVPGVHVIFNLRASKEWNPTLRQEVSVQRVALITTINALRLIADRSGKYEGHGPFIFYYGVEGDDFKESKVPLGRVPHAVSVEGFRKDWRAPLFATARYDAYCQLKGTGNERRPTMMWSTRGEEQLAKCCEALMLKTVAPEECGGLLIAEELGEAIDRDDRQDVSPSVVEKVTIPTATVAPAVNQAPAPKVTESVTPAPVKAPVAAAPAPVDPKPQPSPAPAPVAAPAPAKAPVGAAPGGLFANTTPPDPANETRVFPTVLPVDPLLKAALDAAKPGEVGPTLPVAPAVTPAATQAGDAPATAVEYHHFTNQRATKIIRDKLKPLMKEQDASNYVKNYLLKQSGKTGLKQISAVTFERLLKTLEDATPEQCAEIVKTQSK